MAALVSLKSRIPQIVGELPKTTDDALHEALGEIAQDAADRAPTGATGDLQESIEVREDGIYAIWRWFFTEFGTVNAPAQPFLLPAWEAGRQRLLDEVENALEDL